MLVEKNIIISNKEGLHARPAALFVQIANKYSSEISITKDDETVNGKSIMGILMLAAGEGSKITIKINGDDAEQAILELEKLLLEKEEV
ncbi:MAG: HPr family phosphocarrier protein [Candidatus Omnitrophota bacterium]